MSRFRHRCAELRARVLAAGKIQPVSDKREMPTPCNLKKHVNGNCRCDSELPALEYKGVGIRGHWQFSEAPPCLNCGTDLLVDRLGGPDHSAIKCHGCDSQQDREEYAEAWLRTHGVDLDANTSEVSA